ncbi:MAG: InlB B-repeat-containing protein, partial [Oscillospiraceae bacterium]|nr:InlB B-repeat-containing protein [Oscillospiraceae bacterium]
GLADTVNMDSFGAPPVRLQIGATGSIMDVIEGWIDLSVGLDGFDLTMSDIEIADLDFIKEMGIHASWDAGNKTINGRDYWGLSTEMGQYLVIAVHLPGTGIEDYYGDPVEIPAFISATGSVDYGGFVGYCVEGNTIYFVYRLTASALLKASLNIPKGIIGGFFPMSAVKLGSVDLGFYAAATASSSVDKSKMDGFSPTSILNQMARNANIKFDAAVGAKVVVGAGLLKGNVRIIYVLGDKGLKIDGGWGEGQSLDLSGYVDRGTRSMSVLTTSRDTETGDIIPTIVEAGMQSVILMGEDDESAANGGDPDDIVLSRTRASNSFNAEVSSAAAGKEFLVITLTDEDKVVGNGELEIRYYSDSEPEGRILGAGDLIPATFDPENGDQNNASANFFVSPGLVYFAPDMAGTYQFTLSADGVQIETVEVIKTAEFAALDKQETSLDTENGDASYLVTDPDPEKLYKIQLMLGEERGAGDYLLAETDNLTDLTYDDSLSFSLTGNIAPSGTYYPTLLLLEYVTASDEAGNTVSTWTLADQISFDAVSYTNNAAPAAPGNVTLTYSGNETMTASWTAPAVPEGYTVTGYQLTVYDEEGSQTGVFFSVNGLKDESGTLTEAPATELIMDLSTLTPPSEGANYSVGVKAVCETGEQLELTGAEAVSSPALLKKKASPTLSYSSNVIRGEGGTHTLAVGANGAEFTVSASQTVTVTVTDAAGNEVTPDEGKYPLDPGTDTTLTVLARNASTLDYALEYIVVSSDDMAPPLVLDNMGVFPRHETSFGYSTYVTGHTEAGASVYFWKEEGYTAEIANARIAGADGSFIIPLQFTEEPESGTIYIQAMDAAGNLSAALTVSFASDPVTVILDKNDNNADCATASISTERGSSAGPLPKAYARDKFFIGWYTEADGGEAVDSTSIFDEDTVIYARWADSVTLSYYEGSFIVAEIPVRKGAAIGELPEPVVTYDNKLFLGWSVGPEGELVTENTRFDTNKNLYARWVDCVTVTFDAGQGRCEADELRIPKGGKISAYPEAELSGHTFEGWYDEDVNAVSASTKYNKDTALHARWSRITAPLAVAQSGCAEGDVLPDPVFTVPADAVGSPIISYVGTGGTVYAGSAKPTAAGSYTVTVRCDSFDCAYTGSAAFVITQQGVTRYNVTVAGGSENGSVIADKITAVSGETVTLTAAPAEGWAIDTLTVTKGGDPVALTPDGDGRYTFTVTVGDVAV